MHKHCTHTESHPQLKPTPGIPLTGGGTKSIAFNQHTEFDPHEILKKIFKNVDKYSGLALTLSSKVALFSILCMQNNPKTYDQDE